MESCCKVVGGKKDADAYDEYDDFEGDDDKGTRHKKIRDYLGVFPKCLIGKNSQIIPYFCYEKNAGLFGSVSQVDTWEKLPNNTVFFLRGPLNAH